MYERERIGKGTLFQNLLEKNYLNKIQTCEGNEFNPHK